jgi:hypothetical protein
MRAVTKMPDKTNAAMVSREMQRSEVTDEEVRELARDAEEGDRGGEDGDRGEEEDDDGEEAEEDEYDDDEEQGPSSVMDEITSLLISVDGKALVDVVQDGVAAVDALNDMLDGHLHALNHTFAKLVKVLHNSQKLSLQLAEAAGGGGRSPVPAVNMA